MDKPMGKMMSQINIASQVLSSLRYIFLYIQGQVTCGSCLLKYDLETVGYYY